MNLWNAFFSPEKRAARLEARLHRAILADDLPQAVSLFRKSFDLFLEHRQPQLLSDLILAYGPRVEDVAPLETVIPPTSLRRAIGLLDRDELDAAALALCERCGFDSEAVEILAKRGRANDLAALLTRDRAVDKKLVGRMVAAWEQHNGDIRTSPTMGDLMMGLQKIAPESLPANPRVKEILGQFQEAAELYEKEGDLRRAAGCYEEAKLYGHAARLYLHLGDKERASRAAESLGDLEEALTLAVNPERKFHLLLQMERFSEAREFAAGLERPAIHFDLIKKTAREKMQVKIESHDFETAIELADVADCGPGEREEIVAAGRRHYDRKLASASSEEQVRSIFYDRARLEEKAGNFEEAGRLAEEILEDLELASLLYEKANLFHKAIGTASGNLRLAQLHERGGNHLVAARLYEEAEEYDKAFSLYEGAQHFQQAIECYLKMPDPQRKVLIRLYTGAGEFERVVETYMESGELSDLDLALSLATTHGLSSHARVIQERVEDLISGSEQDLAQAYEEAKSQVVGSYSCVIGIDFGTTNSVVALFNKESKKVEVVPNAQGLGHEPSFFGLDEQGRLIFGEAARLRALTAPDCAVARVKRSLGENVTFSLRGETYRCEKIVASLLRHLVSNAATYVQSQVDARFRELIESRSLRFSAKALDAFRRKQNDSIHFRDVVLSVPAYFNDNQKRGTRDSAEIAGLRVHRLLHEPTSAALAYSYQRPYSGTLAVIDLGGGTLDISILDIGEGVSEVLTVGGDTRLGGSDIDAILVHHAVANIKERWGIDVDEATHPIEINRLRDACENLKINLSSTTEYAIELAHFMNRPRYNLTLTRAELERLSEPILDRIRATVEGAIKDWGSSIDNFILVGNATKMPAVRDLVRDTIQANELRGIDPGTVVATGAALEASILSGDLKETLLLDIVPYSLGIAASTKGGPEQISKLINKDTTIPVCQTGVYSTKKDGQTTVRIRVYQGESAEPNKNFFLGDFVLEGIPPAPAGTPRIEVTFDIGADCILTVTAVDQATRNERSIRIERSVLLSPQEKRDLSRFFAQRERSHSLEQDLQALRLEIGTLTSTCKDTLKSADRSIDDFYTHFHEKVEVNPQLYTVEPEQIGSIQGMILEKDRFRHGIPRYRDRFRSTVSYLRKVETRHLDFGDKDIASKLNERIDVLTSAKQALADLIELVENDVIRRVADWNKILASMEPDPERMNALQMANYYLTIGNASRAKEILEALAASSQGLTEEAFHLLQRCHVSLGLKEAYGDTHRRFAALFGTTVPDFHRLDAYLKTVAGSIFMIQGVSGPQGLSGSGFCLAPGLVVTNRHVVEGMVPQNIRVIGKDRDYGVAGVERDPVNDIAVLRVREALQPLPMGEFGFVEPGEQVLAIGFPSPSSAIHNENIYISRGIVNSIRKIEVSTERVIFVDTKIGGGMSGGPLINALGQVVGIVSLTRYGRRQSEEGMVFVEDQPVALPIHLVKKYLTGREPGA